MKEYNNYDAANLYDSEVRNEDVKTPEKTHRRNPALLWITCYATAILCVPLLFSAAHDVVTTYNVAMVLDYWQNYKFDFFFIVIPDLIVAGLIAWLFSKIYTTKKYGRFALLSALIIPPAADLATAVAFFLIVGVGFIFILWVILWVLSHIHIRYY